MVFETNPQTISPLLAQRRYVAKGRVRYAMEQCSENLEWWSPGPDLEVWVLEPYVDSPGYSKSTVACPSGPGLCYFHASGVE